MKSDKRKGPRRSLRYTAWISLGPQNLHGCVLADISDFGARIEVENQADMPDQFELLLSARGAPRRTCRVVWREGSEIGVEFERPLAATDKNRPILKAEKMTPPIQPPAEEGEVVDIDGNTAETEKA